MINSFAAVSYIAAIALFILSLSGLSKHETARKGNLYGIIGMLLAVIAIPTLMRPGTWWAASSSMYFSWLAFTSGVAPLSWRKRS